MARRTARDYTRESARAISAHALTAQRVNGSHSPQRTPTSRREFTRAHASGHLG